MRRRTKSVTVRLTAREYTALQKCRLFKGDTLSQVIRRVLASIINFKPE